MKIIVEKHDIKIIEEEVVNENEVNIQKCIFEFADDYDEYSNLVKEAIFTKNDKSYKKVIIENQCDVPSEILKQVGPVTLGVCAYQIINDEIVVRFSPIPTIFSVLEGSYRENAENSELLTPSELEQYMQVLNNSLNEIPGIVKEELKSLDLSSLDLSGFVKEEKGKGLSTNDFTNEYKNKLDILDNYDDTNIKDDIKKLNENISNISKLPGVDGKDGENGATFTPSIDEEGNLSWSNDKGLENPHIINIKGPQGLKGEPGQNGADGQNGQPGPQGVPGYTPIKGTDYYTEEDKTEIKKYCKDYIDESYLNKLEGAY